MKYKITTSHHWYYTKTEKFIVKMYFINYIPFTFDEISEIASNDPEIILEATRATVYTPEILYKTSFYLIDEEAHPLLFELELENPELLPCD